MTNISVIYVNMVISNSKGNYPLSSTLSYNLASTIESYPRGVGTWQTVTINSGLLQTAGIPVFETHYTPQKLVFNGTGTYNFTVQLRGVPVANPSNSSSISVYVASANLHLDGGAYGILGTDSLGNDVWSQLVWGSRVSLEIGIAAGVGAVGLGALAGVAAGYLGGLWDEILSRVTDFVLVLPFLPLLIICVEIISSNPFLLGQVYFWIISLFIVVSWPLIAKIIRSQVLTVKERQYVEASRAVGGGTGHILRRHILPNVMGLVYSQVALNVAGFILLEAALDFLSLSAHQIGVISWGLMLTNALPFAVGDSAASHVWWWFLPPGISIASLSLAFVLVGFALDSIFNPRLRAR
jgi:peptide/nickel transport system permease protein